MYIEKLTNKEIKEIVEPIIEKYNLRKSPLNIRLFNIIRNNDNYEIEIAKVCNNMDGPVINHLISILISDFDFFALALHDENEKSANREFRKAMYSKFGAEYKYNLNQELEERKQAILKEQEQELDEEITEVMQGL